MRATIVAALLLASSGCGDGKVAVTGSVTFDGAPMPDGYVIFTPSGGAPASGPIIAGKYELAATPGPHRVEIEASKFVGPENPIMGLRPREQYVPARYNSETTLNREVTADGDNVFDFSLTSKKE